MIHDIETARKQLDFWQSITRLKHEPDFVVFMDWLDKIEETILADELQIEDKYPRLMKLLGKRQLIQEIRALIEEAPRNASRLQEFLSTKTKELVYETE